MSDQQNSSDIPVLNELANLIGSLDLDTPHKLSGHRETDETIKAELKEVSSFKCLCIHRLLYYECFVHCREKRIKNNLTMQE